MLDRAILHVSLRGELGTIVPVTLAMSVEDSPGGRSWTCAGRYAEVYALSLSFE